mgnify:CR=1 FL=1
MSRSDKAETSGNYTKGSFRMVDKGNGRVVLESTSVEDAESLNLSIDSLAASLDTSDLSLQNDQDGSCNNPYDSDTTRDKAAKAWSCGAVR